MKFANVIQKLCDSGEKVIESEKFRGLYYVIKEDSVAVLTEKNGKFAIAINIVQPFCEELQEICEGWGDVKTRGCIT